jgi:hypothetical protein
MFIKQAAGVSNSGKTQTLNVRMRGRVFYHSAAAVTKVRRNSEPIKKNEALSPNK